MRKKVSEFPGFSQFILSLSLFGLSEKNINESEREFWKCGNPSKYLIHQNLLISRFFRPSALSAVLSCVSVCESFLIGNGSSPSYKDVSCHESLYGTLEP